MGSFLSIPAVDVQPCGKIFLNPQYGVTTLQPYFERRSLPHDLPRIVVNEHYEMHHPSDVYSFHLLGHWHTPWWTLPMLKVVLEKIDDICTVGYKKRENHRSH